ncbi:UNVERIFIED_CONTAM: hypothetical protein RMT77_013051 [Armadillidium vulgare]
MDITNKPGPTSKRKHKLGFHLGGEIISYVAIFLVIFPTTYSQSLIDLYCEDGHLICYDEKFEFPFPICVNNTCTCRKGSCVHFTTIKNEFYDYYCGECGTIGSICTGDISCQYPGVCYAGFCRCQSGYLVDDVCLKFEPVSTSTWSIALISILIFLLLLNKIIVSFDAIKDLFWKVVRCRSCRRREDSDEDTAYGYNEEGRDKSPAYTISSRDFISSSDDPDLEWALELSAELARTESDRRRSLANFRLTRRNARYWRQRQPQSSSPNLSIRSDMSSSTSSATSASSRNSSIYGTSRQTSRPSSRRRGYYSLFHENETSRGEEVIITRILNHLSRRTSEPSAANTETAFNSITSTVDSESNSGACSTSPESIKRMSHSEEASEKLEECSTPTGESETSGRSEEVSDSDFGSTSSRL